MENGAKVGGEQEAGAGLHRALTRSRVDSVLWRWTLTLRRFCSALGLICGGVSMETLRLRHLDYSKSEVGVEPELTPSLQTAHLLIKGKNSAERDCRPGPLISLPFPPEAEAGDQGHSSRGPSPPVGHSPSLWPGDTPPHTRTPGPSPLTSGLSLPSPGGSPPPTSAVWLRLSPEHHLHVRRVLGAVWDTGGSEQTDHTLPRRLVIVQGSGKRAHPAEEGTSTIYREHGDQDCQGKGPAAVCGVARKALPGDVLSKDPRKEQEKERPRV